MLSFCITITQPANCLVEEKAYCMRSWYGDLDGLLYVTFMYTLPTLAKSLWILPCPPPEQRKKSMWSFCNWYLHSCICIFYNHSHWYPWAVKHCQAGATNFQVGHKYMQISQAHNCNKIYIYYMLMQVKLLLFSSPTLLPQKKLFSVRYQELTLSLIIHSLFEMQVVYLNYSHASVHIWSAYILSLLDFCTNVMMNILCMGHIWTRFAEM